MMLTIAFGAPVSRMTLMRNVSFHQAVETSTKLAENLLPGGDIRDQLTTGWSMALLTKTTHQKVMLQLSVDLRFIVVEVEVHLLLLVLLQSVLAP